MIAALFRLECLGLLAACVVACLLCRKGSSPPGGARRGFRWLARRRWLAVAVVGLLATAGAASLTPLICKPLPNYHDEFSYLLAADTFAHGRLANPTHPAWVHLETFHVIHEPTYASKYPPGQGMMLALGQVLGGGPILGVWISMGLCCGGICWMLQGWLPPRWALAGALLYSGKLVFVGEYGGTVGYWGQTYWGGAVAAFGSALTFGAVRRLIRRPAVGLSVTLGVGLVILANSRPFEGLVISLPVAALLVGWTLRRGSARFGELACRVWLPLALVLLAGAGCMAYYNARVTGNPLRLPYLHHESIYAVAPSFAWQPLRPEPAYNHPVVRDFWTGWACDDYFAQRRNARLFWLHQLTKVERLWFFFLGLSLTVPFVLALWRAVRSDRWFLFALFCCGLSSGVLMLHVGVQPHYAAPMTGLAAFLVTASLRRVSAWRCQGLTIGRGVAVGVMVNCVLVMAGSVYYGRPRVVPDAWPRERDRVARQLVDSPGRHLVIVHYRPDHVVDEEWVYNEADLDGSRVVWARSMNPQADHRLIDHFKGRQTWLLDADAKPPRLQQWSPIEFSSGAKAPP